MGTFRAGECHSRRNVLLFKADGSLFLFFLVKFNLSVEVEIIDEQILLYKLVPSFDFFVRATAPSPRLITFRVGNPSHHSDNRILREVVL